MLTCVRSKNPTVAVTTDGRTFTWDTDIVYDQSVNQLYYLDKAGTVTSNPSEATSVVRLVEDNGIVHQYQTPIDASSAYKAGDIVYDNGHYFQSKMDDNVWSPLEAQLTELWKEINMAKYSHKALISYVKNCSLPPLSKWEYDPWEE